MADREIRLDFIDSNGQLKPFETFMSEIREVYDQLEDMQMDKFIKELTGPQNDYDPKEVLSKFHFVDRKLYLNTEINDEVAKEFLEKIQFWNAQDDYNDVPKEDRGAIQIYINTPGGDLFSTWQIIDTIKNSITPVVTIVTGTAYSGGFFIAIAGHERQAFPHAAFMFHQGSTLVAGDAHKFLQQADNYKDILKAVKKHVLSNTKISSELYDKHKPDDWYMDTKTALKYKVIDLICNNTNGALDDREEEEINEE